jgi:hypothetical protein
MKANAEVVDRLATLPSASKSTFQVGVLFGDAVSVFQNAYRVSRVQIKPGQAAVSVVKDTVGTGQASAAGAAVVTGLGMGGLGIVGFFAVSGLSMGWWDAAVGGDGRRIEAKPPAVEKRAPAEA